MFCKQNIGDYSQFEIIKYNAKFLSVIDSLHIASKNTKPQKKLTGLKLNQTHHYSPCDQRHDFDDYFNNSLNDSLIDESTSSIKKIDFMSENIELTDLGESSILKFLNEVSNKKNQYMHKHSITEMTINSLIEEINENIDDNEQPEALSTYILNSLSKSLRSGVIVKKKNEVVTSQRNNDSIFYKDFGIKDRNKLKMAKVVKNVFKDISKYEDETCQLSFEHFTLKDEIIDMINLCSKLKNMNRLISFINNKIEDIVDIDNVRALITKEITCLIFKFLYKSNSSQFQSIKNYEKRVKRYHQLQHDYNFSKHFSNELSVDIIHGLEEPITDSLLHNIKFSIELPINRDLGIKNKNIENINSLALREITNEYKYLEINQITTIGLYLEMLNMFDNIVTFQNISNTYCTQYNTNEDAKENELLMNKQCLLLFKFLEVAEILRNHEFIVKVHAVFNILLQTSLTTNKFELFSNLIKSQIDNYFERLDNILPADRSITALHRIENNLWGKYTVTKLCVDEFENLITLMSHTKNVTKPIQTHKFSTNINKNYSFSEDFNYTTLLNLKVNDEQSYTQWLLGLNEAVHATKTPKKKTQRFKLIKKIIDRFHRVREPRKINIEAQENKEVSKNDPAKKLSIFDIFGIDKINSDDTFKSLDIVARHTKN